MFLSNRFLSASVMGLALTLGSVNSFAAEPAKAAAKVDPATQKVVDQLVSSGTLARMIDEGINRRIESDQKAAAEQQKQMLQNAKLQSAKARPFSPTKDRFFGNPKAEVSIILYSDLECYYCKRFNPTPEAVVKTFGDKVNVIWRNFPIPSHGDVARKEAVAAECVAKQAGNEGFFKFTSGIFAATALNGQGIPGGDDAILKLAKESGVKSEPNFDKCMTDPASVNLLDADIKDGRDAGVNGTPGVLIRINKTGATTALQGAVPQADVEQVIRDAFANQGDFAPKKAAAKK